MTVSSDWLTTLEAAQVLKVHKITLTRWAHGGHIPATKIGKEWRFSRQEIESWMRDPVKRYKLIPTSTASTSFPSLELPYPEPRAPVS